MELPSSQTIHKKMDYIFPCYLHLLLFQHIQPSFEGCFIELLSTDPIFVQNRIPALQAHGETIYAFEYFSRSCTKCTNLEPCLGTFSKLLCCIKCFKRRGPYKKLTFFSQISFALRILPFLLIILQVIWSRNCPKHQESISQMNPPRNPEVQDDGL